MIARILATLLPLLVAADGLAATPDVPDCSGPEFHRLDFRIGAFEVATASGIRAGRSQVAKILAGCAVQEEWQGAISGYGRGTTAYDAATSTWYFFYVNESGNQLRLSGGFVGDAIDLQGPGHSFDGRAGLHRMRWSPLPGGGVRQLWTFSTDGGRQWTQILDARHRRIGGQPEN